MFLVLLDWERIFHMKKPAFATVLALGLFAAAAALAGETAPTTPKIAVSPKPTDAARDVKMIECRQKADVQGLSHKDRRKFVEKCKKGE